MIFFSLLIIGIRLACFSKVDLALLKTEALKFGGTLGYKRNRQNFHPDTSKLVMPKTTDKRRCEPLNGPVLDTQWPVLDTR